MRKLTGLIVAILLLVSIVGCGSKDTYNTLPQDGEKEPTSIINGILKDVDLVSAGIVLTGYNGDMKLSPDGKMVVFSGYNFTNDYNLDSKVVLANLEKGEVKTFSDASRVLSWFPDNLKVLYVNDSGLKILDTSTGEHKTIAQDSWYGAISPDGNLVAYVQRGKGLFIYDIATSQSRNLTGDGYHWYPIWYPDGKHIFYFCDLGQELGDGAGMLEGMAKISVDTGEVQRLGSKEGKFRRAQWIVPGKSLHIAAGWDDGFSHGIYNLEQNKYVDLGESLMDSSYFLAVDIKNGRLLKSTKGQVEVYDGQGTVVQSYSLPAIEQEYFNFTVSPKGDQIAFVQGDYGWFIESEIQGNKVKIADYTGQNVKELSGEYKYNETITWDKVGENVISLQMDQEKITSISVMAVK